MKFSIASTVFYFVASTLTSVSAADVSIIVRSTIVTAEPLTPSEVVEIKAGIETIAPEIDQIVEKVEGEANPPPNRYLRDSDQRRLPDCIKCGSTAQLCWVWPGYYVDNCSTRRNLFAHVELSEESIAELNEDERSRHLLVAALCREAKTGITSAITEAENVGIVPIPEGSKLIEECFYEYV